LTRANNARHWNGDLEGEGGSGKRRGKLRVKCTRARGQGSSVVQKGGGGGICRFNAREWGGRKVEDQGQKEKKGLIKGKESRSSLFVGGEV